MLNDLSLLLFAWFMISLWQLIALPLLPLLFGKHLVDGGWAWGRMITWLSSSLIIWFMAHFGLPVNTQRGIWLVLILLVTISFAVAQKTGFSFKDFYQKYKVFIWWEEALFLVGLLFLGFVRAHNPDILDLEKFMDAGLMVTYAKSPTLPAADMWLAGKTMNYYTFGHYLGSVIHQYWQLSIAYSYNLLLAFLFGLVLSQGFSVVVNLVRPFLKETVHSELVKAGIIGVILVFLGANSHPIWYVLTKGSFERYWYPDATRFIDRTIHEFPAYSFVVSDLHAHVWSLAIVLFLIVITSIWVRQLATAETEKQYLFLAGLMGVLFGVLMMTSAWDVAVYGLVVAIFGLSLIFTDFKRLFPLIYSALLVGGGMLVTSSMWWLNFESISEGVRVATEHSPVWQLLVLWTGHVLMSGAAMAVVVFLLLRQKLSRSVQNLALLIIALTLGAWILLVIPELIYVKDIYPNHPRANTMFKLTFQAFVMMGFLGAWFIGVSSRIQEHYPKIVYPLKSIVFLIVLAMGAYPFLSYPNYYGQFQTYKGLDGMAWLKRDLPDDYAAIEWLNTAVKGQPTIVEAVGESYTTFARVSTFTGNPTILGWRVHEWLWRGGFDIPRERTEEVRTIYESPRSPQAQELLKRYSVDFIVVGQKEREAYKNLDIAGLQQLGPTVFNQGNTFIVFIQ